MREVVFRSSRSLELVHHPSHGPAPSMVADQIIRMRLLRLMWLESSFARICMSRCGTVTAHSCTVAGRVFKYCGTRSGCSSNGSHTVCRLSPASRLFLASHVRFSFCAVSYIVESLQQHILTNMVKTLISHSFARLLSKRNLARNVA